MLGLLILDWIKSRIFISGWLHTRFDPKQRICSESLLRFPLRSLFFLSSFPSSSSTYITASRVMPTHCIMGEQQQHPSIHPSSPNSDPAPSHVAQSESGGSSTPPPRVKLGATLGKAFLHRDANTTLSQLTTRRDCWQCTAELNPQPS